MQAPVNHFSLSRWTAMTALGWLLGMAAAIALAGIAEWTGFTFTFFGLVVAAFVGLMQWLVIRKFAVSPGWIVDSALGVGIGFFLVEGSMKILSLATDGHIKEDEAFYFFPLEAALGGLACGWLESRNQLSRISSASGWSRTQLAAWFIPMAIMVIWFYFTTTLTHSRNPVLLYMNFLFIFGPGALVGWISGRKLKGMLSVSEHHWIKLPPL